jgi:thioredoxin
MAASSPNAYTTLTSPEAVDRLMQPDGGTWVIDFWAPWCGPCRAMAPHFEAVARDLANQPVRFAKVDTEAHPEIGAAFHVQAIPTLIFVHNGEILDVSVGALDSARLRKKVDWLLSKARGEGFFTRFFGGTKKSPAHPA